MYTGYPSLFVRFAGCNLRCCWDNGNGTMTACDTNWANSSQPRQEVDCADVIQRMAGLLRRDDHIVFTGGEPTLQVDQLNHLAAQFSSHEITVETNGTIPVCMPQVKMLSISPKLSFSCNPVTTTPEGVAELFAKNPFAHYQLKYVVSNEDEMDEIEDFDKDLKGLTDQNWASMLMPQGISSEQLDQRAAWVADQCKRLGWIMSDRLHIRIWGGKRGV
jgi:7-carboxy-7-deazaguanine synthase